MDSCVFRKCLIPASYFVVIAISVLYAGTMGLRGFVGEAMVVLGLVLFIFSCMAAARIHSRYPSRHDRPSDFPELLTEGPYSVCRHPFYGSLMLNLLSVPLMLLSLHGLAAFAALMPLWMILMKLEEKELLEYWSDKYREYMARTPMLIPLPRRRRRS